MRIAQIVGTVTLSRLHPSFQGACLKLAVPLSLSNLRHENEPDCDPVVVWDEWGVGMGDRIALAEGSEAAQPFRPAIKPVDAYNAATLDRIDLDEPPAPPADSAGLPPPTEQHDKG
ncbi:MAG: carbon dioxide concentrating mechanism protein CcmL [Candidatus Anammoximicrobium sp.]|nr:carbon dioxide concentrating mechanism protein CcmL [Candidatus Anammoximicrobium sp.]